MIRKIVKLKSARVQTFSFLRSKMIKILICPSEIHNLILNISDNDRDAGYLKRKCNANDIPGIKILMSVPT